MSSTIKVMVLLLASWLVSLVHGHGRLIEPPSRSSMWRFGFNTPPNYNDNELFCGGFTVQWQYNSGKCGICGDAWHAKEPRPNEAGGKYGRGIIVRNYVPGQVIDVVAELTANHKGFFEFKLCPNNNPKRVATQECLDQYPLVVDKTGETTFPVTTSGPGKLTVRLRLPPGLKCTQCVLQWSYTSGNNWGTCPDGRGKVGCGPQETFRGCADVSIGFQSPSSPDDPESNSIQSPRPNIVKPRPTKLTSHFSKPTKATYYTTKRKFRPTTFRPSYPAPSSYSYRPRPRPSASTTFIQYVKPKPKPTKASTVVYNQWNQHSKPTKSSLRPVSQEIDDKRCRGVGPWKRIPGMDTWCDQNCSRGYCPSSHCLCS